MAQPRRNQNAARNRCPRAAVTGDRATAHAARNGEQAIYLHEIQDPGNLGTILRTLAWFGNFRCLLSPGSVDPYNSKVVRASMGAIFHVPFEIDVELAALATRFARIACLDMHGGSLQSPRVPAIRLLSVRQRSPRRTAGTTGGTRRNPLHHRRKRRHRVIEPRIGRQHVCLRTESERVNLPPPPAPGDVP